jgi:hypothetical protein
MNSYLCTLFTFVVVVVVVVMCTPPPKLLRRSAKLPDLAECLKLEYRVAQKFMTHPDFVKGVAAVLGLDGGKKGAAVKWAPSPTKDEVEEFFMAGESKDLTF